MHDARETYREYSGAEPSGATPTPAPPTDEAPPVPRSRALAERGRQAARRLSRERPKPTPPARQDDPDVVLDIPNLHVDEIALDIAELKAKVSLEARVLDLLRLDVGVDAELRDVGLKIKGVDAEAHLKVRLENLTTIVDRVMSTIDRNPQILERLTAGLGATLEEVGSGAGRALGEIGEGAGKAVEDVGSGAARALGDIGESAGKAVEDVGSVARTLPANLAKPNARENQ
jgi:hypothetical protein